MNPCSCNNSPGLVTREGVEVCPACKRPPKKGEDFGGATEQKADILTRDQLAAEVRQLRRILNGVNNRLEKLDDALNAN